MNSLKSKRPSPALVVSVTALIVALAGTAYAAQHINGGAIKNQTIGGGKLKKNTLTGFQIKVNKLGVVPTAKRAAHTYWAVVKNLPGPDDATLARASDAGISAVENEHVVSVVFPQNVRGCADVAARNDAGTTTPFPGSAQTNGSPTNANAIEVHTSSSGSADADFHLIVVCP